MRDFNCYALPETPFSLEHPQTLTSVTVPQKDALISSNRTSEVGDLTPLEMPDGTTRMTANWLPVDPEGGFIVTEPKGELAAELPGGGNIFDTMLIPHVKNVFFSVESTVPALGA